jgi:phosphonate degradation associated HDIG domain protein
MTTLDTIVDWLRNRADGLYGGEAVTQLQHALQCASLAQAEGAHDGLVAAALLHDIYHLAERVDDAVQRHEEMGARMLSDLFPPAVTEPVRLHVQAKRYLCAIDSQYWAGLSEMSKQSLAWQGGPFRMDEAAAFSELLFARDAVRLRRWDDAAKVVGKVTPGLDEFVPVMRSVAYPRI